jgi:hypothetical protein
VFSLPFMVSMLRCISCIIIEGRGVCNVQRATLCSLLLSKNQFLSVEVVNFELAPGKSGTPRYLVPGTCTLYTIRRKSGTPRDCLVYKTLLDMPLDFFNH